jgi:hypothetical protein
VLTEDYETVQIRIAFNPQDERFEVANPAIRKRRGLDRRCGRGLRPQRRAVRAHRPTPRQTRADRRTRCSVLERLRKIVNNHVGVIELAEDLDIETVTEIFIRVNSAGKALSQADFAMSKIAANETYGGNLLRKAIDYFCHLSVAPDFLGRIEKGDKAFAGSSSSSDAWLKDVNDDIYVPDYTDMLRVAFTSEFRRGKLQDLVALLSGRNFETKSVRGGHRRGVVRPPEGRRAGFINKTHYDRFTMTLRSAGFATSA